MPGRAVHFADAPLRPARADELFVLSQFAAHTSHCDVCRNVCQNTSATLDLCDRGHAYARDVSQYVYCKKGRAYSTVDREIDDTRNKIEIPRKFDDVNGLLKAIERGMRVKSPRRSTTLKPVVVSQDKHYHNDPVSDYYRRPERRDGYDTVEIAPRRTGREDKRRSGEEKIYVPGRGSLFDGDEEDRRRRRHEGGAEPVIVYASPRSGKSYRR